MIVITGAGSGIGRAIAERFATSGADLLLAGRRREPLEETAALVTARGARATVSTVDLDDPARATETLLAAADDPLELIVHNASWLEVGGIDSVTESALETAMRTNVTSPALIVAAAWERLAAARGAIVAISSMAAYDPFPGLGAYAASKAALESLVRSWSGEGADLGIRAFGVAPGAVETAMLRRVVDAETLPTSQTLAPADIAEVVHDLVTSGESGEIRQAVS